MEYLYNSIVGATDNPYVMVIMVVLFLVVLEMFSIFCGILGGFKK